MKVSAELIITKDNHRCFLIKPGFSRSDTIKWVPYCGKFKDFNYEQGYEYTLRVDQYDPEASEIQIVKIIGQDNSAAYRKQLALRRKREIARAQARLQSQIQTQSQSQLHARDQILAQHPFEFKPEDDYEYDFWEYDLGDDYEYDGSFDFDLGFDNSSNFNSDPEYEDDFEYEEYDDY